MSDRTFFNMRYAYPGYTFLLFLGLLSYDKISTIITTSSNLWSTIIGFLLVLSGAPIGFLLSQIWYLLIGLILKTDSDPFIEKNYIVFKNQEKGIGNYIIRRGDILNTLGSTIVSIILSCVFAYFLYGYNINWYIIAGGIILIIFCYVNIKRIYNEQEKMTEKLKLSNDGS